MTSELHSPQPRMPSPSVYEAEYAYWPWGDLLKSAAHWVREKAPLNGYVVDYMCGTAFLLNEVSKARPDLCLAGCSIIPSYIEHAHRHYPSLDIVCQDVFAFRPQRPPDVILCTGGLHHLTRQKQPELLDKVASDLHSDGHFLLGEEVIRRYQTDCERKLAVIEMVDELLSYAVRREAPDEVLEAALNVLGNDLFERGEYKMSHAMLLSLLEPRFSSVTFEKVWPSDHDAFGDVLYTCTRH